MAKQQLCKIKKLLKNDIEAYVAHVEKPKFVCASCGRVANRKGLLCEPLKISRLKREAESK
ncbi:MAG: hypothetical protein ACR2NP_04350 [Pirellulaceae bacterium]